MFTLHNFKPIISNRVSSYYNEGI